MWASSSVLSPRKDPLNEMQPLSPGRSPSRGRDGQRTRGSSEGAKGFESQGFRRLREPKGGDAQQGPPSRGCP